jgi:predicted cupin superfamily sugar epimerase
LADRAAELIASLDLLKHPEGGWYRQVFRSEATVTPRDGRPDRSALTAIHFLLPEGEHSRWHRVASDEVWAHLEGASVRLWCFDPELRTVAGVQLGSLANGAIPVHAVRAGVWQAAETAGEYSLVVCVVGPGFEFADFRLMSDDAEAQALLRSARRDLDRLI